MITTPTVLVLGAGASVPYGFPSGQSLVDIIVYYFHSIDHSGILINEDRKCREAINKMKSIVNNTISKPKIYNFVEHLYGEESIDAFLEHQTGDILEIGKAVIAAILLSFENDTELYFPFMINRLYKFFGEKTEIHNIGNSWYQLLWQALNAPFEEFHENKLKIITFNYDRSLEHYIFTQLKKRFPGKSDEDYALRVCPIVHIHGSLGLLPWQVEKNKNQNDTIPYGVMLENSQGPETDILLNRKRIKYLDIARQNIKVIHENQEDTDELKQAREYIRQCQNLYFLGFGYHPTNIKRLNIQELEPKHKDIRGTTYKLSLNRKQLFAKIVGSLSTTSVYKAIKDVDIYTFLHDYVNLEYT